MDQDADGGLFSRMEFARPGEEVRRLCVKKQQDLEQDAGEIGHEVEVARRRQDGSQQAMLRYTIAGLEASIRSLHLQHGRLDTILRNLRDGDTYHLTLRDLEYLGL
jgi:hypothetical protein